MPTATEFTALGAGNGFPSCLDKIDVTDFNYVRPMTLEQVSKVFWNLYSVTMTATVSDGEGYTASVSDPNVDTFLLNDVDENPSHVVGDSEPIKRVCGLLVSGYIQKESGDGGYWAARVSFQPYYAYKIYRGPTDDEGNFNNEYGINLEAIAQGGTDNGEVGAWVQLYSIADDTSDTDGWWTYNGSILGTPDLVENVTFSGIPFIRATWNNDIHSTASITGLDFYTY
tara:strand:+ start:1571 stop:2251 length:681 start_codon:yes stop_codon:yes gene_type:complete